MCFLPTVLGLMETYAIALLSRSSSKAASSASASAQPITGHITVTPPTHTHDKQWLKQTKHGDSLLWISRLFLGFGGMTVNALWLEHTNTLCDVYWHFYDTCHSSFTATGTGETAVSVFVSVTSSDMFKETSGEKLTEPLSCVGDDETGHFLTRRR